MGLLSRATFSVSSSLSQVEFSKKFNLRRCAIYTKVYGKMIITDCVGFDAATIAKSVSHEDFWNGTIGNDAKWHSYEKDGLSQFYQFFSDRLKDRIAAVHFFRVSSDVVFMTATFANERIDLPSAEDIQKNLPSFYSETVEKKSNAYEISIPDGEVASLLEVSLERAVEYALGDCAPEIFKKIFENAVFNTVFNKTVSFFAFPNIVTYDGCGKLKIILFSAIKIDTSLFKTHISHSLESVLGDSSKYVEVYFSGAASTQQEIKHFL